MKYNNDNNNGQKIDVTTMHTLMECPACNGPITARVMLTGRLAIGDLSKDKTGYTINGDLVGLQTSHDCMPKKVR